MNPPYGASINYYLRSEQSGDVTLEILNGAGETVRKLDATKHPGVNRVWWNLEFQPSNEARLRTSPVYAPWVKVGDEGWRRAPGMGRISVLAPPGAYTVKLTAGGREFTQPLTVVKDPNSLGSESDIQAQTALLHDLRDNLNAVVDMVNAVELIRSQLLSLLGVLEGDESAASVRMAAKELDEKLVAFEQNLVNLTLTGRGQDGVRWPAKLGSQIAYLADNVSSSDLRPTAQAMDVHEVLEQELRALQQQYGELLRVDLTQLNAMLAEHGVQGVVVRQP